jgi:hypothetical protein
MDTDHSDRDEERTVAGWVASLVAEEFAIRVGPPIRRELRRIGR